MKMNFEEMQVYDFSNVNLQENSANNCFGCDDSNSSDCDSCYCDCDSCDCDSCDCDSCDCDSCDC